MTARLALVLALVGGVALGDEPPPPATDQPAPPPPATDPPATPPQATDQPPPPATDSEPPEEPPPVEEPPAPPEPPRYPFGLAARPLTLPSHMVELAVGYIGTFTGSAYRSDVPLGPFRFSLTDRFEIRDLGVYYALVPKRGPAPEIAAGAAVTGIGYSSVAGGVFEFSAWVDAKAHFGERVAVAPRLVYKLGLQTNTPLPLEHEVTVGVDAFFDVASRVSLVAACEYDLHRVRTLLPDMVTLGTIDLERISPSLAVHVAPLSWLDVQVGIGPSFGWANGSSPVVAGRWHAAIRLRW